MFNLPIAPEVHIYAGTIKINIRYRLCENLNWPAMSKNKIYGLGYVILAVTHLVPYKQILSALIRPTHILLTEDCPPWSKLYTYIYSVSCRNDGMTRKKV
jgi:hypothetical protein